MEGKIRTKIVLFAVLLLLLITPTLRTKYAQYRLEYSQKITKNVAVQVALSYLKLPKYTPLKSINLTNKPYTKNQNAWEVILDFREPNTTRVSRCKVYINSNTGEVLSYAVAGRIAEE
jgi:hypothetical protein